MAIFLNWHFVVKHHSKKEMKPARKPIDEVLFRNMPPDVRALQKQSRKELRQTERRRFQKTMQTKNLDVNP